MSKAHGFGSLWHLASRFFGSVLPIGPSKASESWAIGHLLPGEAALFTSMSGPDRRHAIGVARRAIDLLGDSNGTPGTPTPPGTPAPAPARPFIAAGLLHDVGKTKAHLGTLGRVVATVMAVFLGRDKVVAWGSLDGGPGNAAGDETKGAARAARGGRPSARGVKPSRWSVQGWQTRIGRYLTHDIIGGRLLEGVGSDELTFRWAREHHLPESRWSVERRLGNALKEADGD